ncbi:MAG: ABC-F family ATP-binding cassette domain-containing protein [Candidatus Aminicenantes bacterium]|nr:ABC-F family ATP-binding cassette domain-containing protein [Candidatus Aminicenantes bacterium]
MISLQNIALTYNDKKIFAQISWLISEKSRIGIVGDNGAGKTTLFRAIKGESSLDSGTIEIPKNKRIGYLPQDLVELDPLSVQDYLKKRTGQDELEKNMRSYEEKIARDDHNRAGFEAMLNKFDIASEAFRIQGGYDFDARSRRILKGLGFANDDYAKNCRDFSGGWKMRIFLAVILLANPEIMLLDEPTNHLDTESMEWLENYLKNYGGTLLTISHDHMFLDKMVSQIAELQRGKITIYKGNYSHYRREKERRLAALQKQRELQKTEIKRIQAYIDRFRAKASKASEVQSRIKQLEKFELLPEAEGSKKVHFRFTPAVRSGKEVIIVRDLGKSYGQKQVFSGIGCTIYRGEKIALLGINGAGKSTLVRLLAGSEEPSQGSLQLGHQVKTAFFSQESQYNLAYKRTIWEEVQALDSPGSDLEKRSLLGAFLFSGDDIHKPVAVLSGGEKSRLALVKILLGESNCLILDEPTNHLDLKTKEIFQNALQHYSGTIVLVSHDRYFLDQLVQRVFEIRDGRMYEYTGNYSYFAQKREQEIAAADVETGPLPGQPSASAAGSAASKGGGKSREQRRLEAEARDRRSKLKMEIGRELPALEEEIATLEKLKTRNQSLLCDPDFLKESARIKPLMQELNQASRRLAELYPRWEELTRRLEKVDEMNFS